MTNVFKIRHGKETHVYRTETSGEKKSLLSQFRQVAEELTAKKRKEREGEHERRKSLWQGGGDVRWEYPLQTVFPNLENRRIQTVRLHYQIGCLNWLKGQTLKERPAPMRKRKQSVTPVGQSTGRMT